MEQTFFVFSPSVFNTNGVVEAGCSEKNCTKHFPFKLARIVSTQNHDGEWRHHIFCSWKHALECLPASFLNAS